MLLENDVDLVVPGGEALLAAFSEGHETVVDLLVASGADTEVLSDIFIIYCSKKLH